MRHALQISFRHMQASPALEARIRSLAERLERFSDQMIACHVVVAAPHQHHHQGMRYEVGIDLKVPDREIAVTRAHEQNPQHEDPYVALRDAFHAARRQLQDYERERQGKAAAHAGQRAMNTPSQ
jgi:ribosomal subunit interface protein